MRNKSSDTGTLKNPFCDPNVKPDWAQLTRLGGDRVAILFEELRRRIGAIDGLIEDLHFASQDEGWVPRYSLDGVTIAHAHIGPGSLEVTLCLAGKVEVEEKIRGRAARHRLDSRAAVTLFARLMIRACRRSKGKPER